MAKTQYDVVVEVTRRITYRITAGTEEAAIDSYYEDDVNDHEEIANQLIVDEVQTVKRVRSKQNA